MKNLTLTISYILLVCWLGFVVAAVVANAKTNVTRIYKTPTVVRLDPNGMKPIAVWI